MKLSHPVDTRLCFENEVPLVDFKGSWIEVPGVLLRRVWVERNSLRISNGSESKKDEDEASRALELGSPRLAVAILCFESRTLTVLCGELCASRIYIEAHGEKIILHSSIETLQDLHKRQLDKKFLQIWVEGGLRGGASDVFLGLSPFLRVALVHRGLAIEIGSRGSRIFSNLATNPSHLDSSHSVGDLVACLTSSLSRRIKEITRFERFGSECSGGIDSGVVSALCNEHAEFIGATCASFPYFEFRAEKGFVHAISEHAGFNVFYPAPENYVYWSMLRAPERIPLEPSHLLSSVGQCFGSFEGFSANGLAPKAIITGHGGDLFFSMGEIEVECRPEEARKLIDTDSETLLYWRLLINDFRSEQAYLTSSLDYDNPWMSNVLFGATGATYESLFSDPESIVLVSLLKQKLFKWRFDRSVQKPVAHLIFSHLLPDRVWRRRWKVSHSGLMYRAFMRNGEMIWQMYKSLRLELVEIGFRDTAFSEALRGAIRGKNAADSELILMATFVVWLWRVRNVKVPTSCRFR